jgi:peptidoglycan/xylan/chitin deacetylase (PgdA/CDA1 family)
MHRLIHPMRHFSWKRPLFALTAILLLSETTCTRHAQPTSTISRGQQPVPQRLAPIPIPTGAAARKRAVLNLSAADRKRLEELARAEETAEKGLYAQALWRGNPAQKVVALTFDDGPKPEWTPRLLETLRKLNVRATFFLVGRQVDAYPELTARILLEGHQIANHTYNHQDLTELSPQAAIREVQGGSEAVYRSVGYMPAFFRPPGGRVNDRVYAASWQLRNTAVMWTANSSDYLRPAPEVIVRRLTAGDQRGGILLAHTGIGETIEALPYLVARYRAQGYRFVTITELMRGR